MRKLLLILTLILSIVSASTFAFAQVLNFSDISKHWAKESIGRIADIKLFAGSDGKFHPDKAITRSEFAMMLHKALGIQIMYFKATDIGEFFDDVKNEDMYASALYDLVVANIIDYKGQFKPTSTLTREEMVHFLMNAYKYKMGESYKQIKLPFKPFADDSKINPAYSGDVGRAEYDGLLKRPANNKFYPKDLATRAQAATVIDRLLRLLEKENSQVLVTPAAELKEGVLNMKLTIANQSESQIVINHNSGQKFDFALLDSDRNVLYRWSEEKLFTMALTETVIEPGKSVEFNADIEKALFDSFKGNAVYIKAYIIGTSEDFKVNSDGYEAVIK